MKLVFSEHLSDYDNYIFPYAVWAFRESNEKPRQLFDAGFLPSSPDLSRFYLCRQIRVDLQQFKLSSENRRVLRKCADITVKRVPRARFDFTPARLDFCLRYADARFGQDTMTPQRLNGLLSSPLITHVLLYTDTTTKAEVGLSLMFCEARALAFYYYAFYDLEFFHRNLGIFMMTSAVDLFAQRRTRHLYLGSCYSRNALYKTQFAGVEFFNGFRWSTNLNELKHLLERDAGGATRHALDDPDFHTRFHEGDPGTMPRASRFHVRLPTR